MPQQTFLFKQRGIQFYISLFSSFFPFSNAFPSDLQSTKDAFPFRPQVSSQLSSQTAAVGSTRAQSSSSTQQPGDRRTALLSPTVGLLLSLRLICHTAPTAVLLQLPQQCSPSSHSSHSSAPPAPTAPTAPLAAPRQPEAATASEQQQPIDHTNNSKVI